MTKKIIFWLSLTLVVALGAYIFVFSPKSVTVGASPVGTQAGTAKLATINWSLATNAATTTSIFNNDRQDRIIQGSFIACTLVGTSKTPLTGTGLAALTVSSATSSTANPSTLTNANKVMNATTVATSSPWVLATASAPSGSTLVWPTQTYLSFASNATNTAQCVVGVNYLGT